MFDPFGDYETQGYLRNVAREKDPEIVRHLEHNSFLTGIDTAFKLLGQLNQINYRDVLGTHQILFEAVYPWAGQDRSQNAPDIAVCRGDTLFAHPKDARSAVEHGLRLAQDLEYMKERPGEIFGYFAYGHPFLDGNGRTIMVVHSELVERAGISIEWSSTKKSDYLAALTNELSNPGQGALDAYFKPYLRPAVGRVHLAGHVTKTAGLDGESEKLDDVDKVLGKFSDPDLEARYRTQELKRGAYRTHTTPTYK